MSLRTCGFSVAEKLYSNSSISISFSNKGWTCTYGRGMERRRKCSVDISNHQVRTHPHIPNRIRIIFTTESLQAEDFPRLVYQAAIPLTP